MKKCCVCGAEVTQEYPIPFICSANEEEQEYGCPVCERHLYNYDIRENKRDVHRAIEYFRPYLNQAKDERIRRMLEYVCSDKGAEVPRIKPCILCGMEVGGKKAWPLQSDSDTQEYLWICDDCLGQL